MENQNQTTQYDPQAVAMVRALKMQESGNDYSAPKEKAGISLGGAYQYQAPTWKAYAGEILKDPNAQFTPENQDKVTYGMVKKWKDNGMQPSEIAHMWNPGDSSYPDKVVNHLKKIAGNQTPQNPTSDVSQETQSNNSNSYASQIKGFDTQPTTDTTSTDQTLGQQLGQRGTDISSAVNTEAQGTTDILKGDVIGGAGHIASGLLQGVGALAGGLGDVVSKGLELIPGVKQVENLIGGAVGSLAKTGAGQSVMKFIKEQSDAHPELAKDIGAGFNIVTAIPILRGLGAVGKIGMDAASQALKNTVIKGFGEDLASSGGKIAQRVFTPDVVDTSIKYGVAPDIESISGKTVTNTTKALKTLESEVSRIDNEVYQPALKGVNLKFPMEGVKNIAKDISVKNLSDPAAVNRILDRVALKYGDTPTLEQLNMAKRDFNAKISEAAFGDPDLSNNRIVRMALQKAIEKGGLQFGAGNLGEINKEMGKILQTIEFYDKIDGMSVKQGLLHKGIKAVSTGVGATVGGMMGNPIAGGAIGYGASDYMEGLLTKVTPRAMRAGVIKRTGPNAVKLSKKELSKKMGLLFGGVAGQKLNQNKQ